VDVGVGPDDGDVEASWAAAAAFRFERAGWRVHGGWRRSSGSEFVVDDDEVPYEVAACAKARRSRWPATPRWCGHGWSPVVQGSQLVHRRV